MKKFHIMLAGVLMALLLALLWLIASLEQFDVVLVRRSAVSFDGSDLICGLKQAAVYSSVREFSINGVWFYLHSELYGKRLVLKNEFPVDFIPRGCRLKEGQLVIIHNPSMVALKKVRNVFESNLIEVSTSNDAWIGLPKLATGVVYIVEVATQARNSGQIPY